jgi:pSer/pThr/pTyr-binding forkhead associated (FHA) protein
VERSETFPTPFVLIGRAARNDLRLDDGQVSPRHVYLQVLSGRAFCLGLLSATGMRLGCEARSHGWLLGRPLGVGPFEVRLAPGRPPEAGPVPPDPLGARATEVAALPGVSLVLQGGPAAGERWRMTQQLALIGRHPLCKVRLVDPSVSALHCSLVRAGGGVWLVDLLSREGSVVNGSPVRWARLADGDRVRVGAYEVQVCLRPALASGPAAGGLPLPQPALPVAAGLGPSFSPEELAGLERSLSAPAERSLLLAVVGRLQEMQQQMFDQQQQSLLLIAQLFARLHEDQMDVVRRELDQMQRLGAEVQALRSRLDGAAGRPAADTPRPPALEQTPAPAAGPAERPGRADDAAGADLHAALSRKIGDLQRERQGRWQKLIALMLGK